MTKRKVANKQEKRIVKSLQEIQESVRQTINSGALWWQKSDVISENFRVEAKTKEKPAKQFTVKKEWLKKVEREAFETGKKGILVFSFGDGEDYLIMNVKDFVEFVKSLKENFSNSE